MAMFFWMTGLKMNDQRLRFFLNSVTQLRHFQYYKGRSAANPYFTQMRLFKVNFCNVSCSELPFEDGSSPEDRASQIFDAIQNSRSVSCSKGNFTLLYHYLVDFGIDPSTIESQFLATPDLAVHDCHRWQTVCGMLSKFRIPHETVFKNISMCPDLLQFNVNALESHLTQLNDMYIGKQRILHLVRRNPQLYVFPPKMIAKRMSKLSALFPPTELKNLVRNNPSVLSDRWDTIMEKIMYIHEDMGLEQPHISASEALEKSLLHIKTRHQFLYRAGIYLTPNPRDKTSVKKNADLSFITDTSNKFFANKIARLTEYEYDVFSSMIKEEYDSQISSDEEYEYESHVD